ncbi:MAG: NAD+ synthase [Solirubrobacterales bacterium]
MATGKDSLRLALAQIDTTVGDLDQNAEKIAAWAGRARDEGAELVLFPELCLPGYPAEDLYLKPHFLEANQDVLGELAKRIEGLSALIGFAEPRPTEGENEPRAYNSLALVEGGEVRSVYRKNHLPNYGVFDERRYFEPASEPLVLDVAGVPLGLTICEDIWIPGEPETAEVDAGARLVLNASASPYHRGKGNERERMVAERARACAAPIALCNAVGGQDELVFDGHSFIVDERGEPVARAAQFSEELLVCELALAAAASSSPCPLAELLEPAAEVYAALRLGLRDYGQKNKFDHVVLGLSGGIDSALVALVAVDALGPERVTCVVMPSPHSSDETQGDARGIAENLGCELIELPISEAMKAYERALSGPFDGTEPGLAEENIQARIRGNYVMALSNRFGWLVLTTGNKSEMSVGYATLYGDMAGGFAVIKDVPKTLVYELVRWRNAEAGNELVPASVIERAPSAELRPEQRDEDSLPPYEVLDAILEAYVERDQSPEQMIEAGLPADEVAKAVWLVDKAEYKRRQAPPGIKITPKAFGRDRRLPITNRYRD